MPSSLNGTGVTFSNGTTQSTAATGTVSSVATGNGLSGGTITTTGTLAIAAPAYDSVGAYTYAQITGTASPVNMGMTFSGSVVRSTAGWTYDPCMGYLYTGFVTHPGTWRIMGSASFNEVLVLWVRVS